MKIKIALLLVSQLLINITFAQKEPVINITFSKLLATYDFAQKLSEGYPDNEFKKVFTSSKFNTQHYTGLIKQLDTLNIYESYSFQGYPVGQKMSVMTTSLIEKNLITSTSIEEFKRHVFGIIPNEELFTFSSVISKLETIYDSLVFTPNREKFTSQINDLKNFVQKANLSAFFQKGLAFYGSSWDPAIPIDIAILPSTGKGGFSAKAFLNNAVSEVPVNFKDNNVLFSVLMHEIFHNLYDGQSLERKLKIQSWFNSNPSKNSQYAYLLLNEALATALGNGYVYEQITGKPDQSDWYHLKYINLMAKQIYPAVKQYLANNSQIDKRFVDSYVASYDSSFSGWVNELDHLFTHRYVLADSSADLDYFRKNYRYASFYLAHTPVNQIGLEGLKKTPVTKLVIISSDHKNKLATVKAMFPELKSWKYKPQQEFVYVTTLEDKTRLLIINRHSKTLKDLMEKNLKNRRIE